MPCQARDLLGEYRTVDEDPLTPEANSGAAIGNQGPRAAQPVLNMLAPGSGPLGAGVAGGSSWPSHASNPALPG